MPNCGVAVVDTAIGVGAADREHTGYLDLAHGGPAPVGVLTHGDICSKIIKAVAPDAALMRIAVLRGDRGSVRRLTEALRYLLTTDVRLISLSLGTANVSHAKTMESVVMECLKRGKVMVSAASNRPAVSYPASFRQVIGVRRANAASPQGIAYSHDAIDGVEVEVGSGAWSTHVPPHLGAIHCNSYAAALICGLLARQHVSGADAARRFLERAAAATSRTHNHWRFTGGLGRVLVAGSCRRLRTGLLRLNSICVRRCAGSDLLSLRRWARGLVRPPPYDTVVVAEDQIPMLSEIGLVFPTAYLVVEAAVHSGPWGDLVDDSRFWWPRPLEIAHPRLPQERVPRLPPTVWIRSPVLEAGYGAAAALSRVFERKGYAPACLHTSIFAPLYGFHRVVTTGQLDELNSCLRPSVLICVGGAGRVVRDIDLTLALRGGAAVLREARGRCWRYDHSDSRLREIGLFIYGLLADQWGS